MYIDENAEELPPLVLENGLTEQVKLKFAGPFRYLDTKGNDLSKVEVNIKLPEKAEAPVQEGGKAGEVIYSLNGSMLGKVDILFAESVEKAGYADYLYRVFLEFLM